jgi:hypothetical protein
MFHLQVAEVLLEQEEMVAHLHTEEPEEPE